MNRLQETDQIKPVLHESETTTAFINLKWPFFLILLLLGAEWFIRKYFGGSAARQRGGAYAG